MTHEREDAPPAFDGAGNGSAGSPGRGGRDHPGSQDASGGGAGLALLYDLPLPVSVELGRTRLPVQEILGLGRGSVVQLDRLAGEPVDLFVGDRKFAQGEVVVLGEQFGVRITRILPAGGPLPGQAG
ncbi:MAG: flagellar motor switch protein FliN [Gemmatimonadales bacterium]|nr:MAG: flagellar motor switch protein FliN [Gemmatimonadales bacterium]